MIYENVQSKVMPWETQNIHCVENIYILKSQYSIRSYSKKKETYSTPQLLETLTVILLNKKLIIAKLHSSNNTDWTDNLVNQ